jgi:transposase InsO family protein
VNGWILSLQEFDYEIFHIAGKTNIVADALSRVPKDLLTKMEAEERKCVEKLHGAQGADEVPVRKVKVILRQGESVEEAANRAKELRIGSAGGEWEYEPEGLGRCDLQHWKEWRRALVRFLKTEAFEDAISRGERRRIITMAGKYRIEAQQGIEGHRPRLMYKNRFEEYVPVPRDKQEIETILEPYHDEPCAGHYASEMTFRRVYRFFFWPTMRYDIHHYVQSCDRCQKARDLAEYPVEPLRPIVCLEPFEIIHVDYSGPYEQSAGKRYCLYIIDAFTGWLEVEACSRATAEMTIRLLEGYCTRFGFPRVIHSDHGPHFDNEECRSWATASGIKWIFGSPGQAKGQGKVERSIRDVKTSIRKLADEQPKIWLKLLKDSQFAFNTRYPYSQRGDSPAMLLFGYNPRLRVVNLIEPAQVLPTPRAGMIEHFRQLRLARLDCISNEAVTRQLDQWTQRTEAYNKHLRSHRYRVGDLVLYQNYSLKGKPGHPWAHRWRGPVTIIHISFKGKLDLQHPEGDIMKGWHTDKVRPYVLRA